MFQSGARPDKTTFKHLATALHWAATHGHLGMNFLSSWCWSSFFSTSARWNLAGATKLLQQAYICKITKKSAFVCWLCRKFNWIANVSRSVTAACVKLLVEDGASLAAQTVSGRTPLMLAARSDHRDTFQVFFAFVHESRTTDNISLTGIAQKDPSLEISCVFLDAKNEFILLRLKPSCKKQFAPFNDLKVFVALHAMPYLKFRSCLHPQSGVHWPKELTSIECFLFSVPRVGWSQCERARQWTGDSTAPCGRRRVREVCAYSAATLRWHWSRHEKRRHTSDQSFQKR